MKTVPRTSIRHHCLQAQRHLYMLEADYMWALKDTSATPAGGQPDQHLGRESLRLRWMNSEPRPVYADAAECLGDSSSLREGLATQRMRGERGRATTYWARHSLLWRISDARIKRHTSASNNTHCRREFQMTLRQRMRFIHGKCSFILWT